MPPDGMPLDTTPAPAQTESSTAAPAPQQPAPSQPTYSQEQVNAMIAAQLKAQHDSINADWRRKTEKPSGNPPPSTKPEPTGTQSAPSVEQVAALVAQAVAKESAFGDAARELGLNGMQAALLRQLPEFASLPDAFAVTAYVKDKAALFGTVKNTPTTATAPTVAAQVPAPIAPSAVSTAVPLERDVSELEMTPEQIHELMRKKGANPARPYQLSNGREARRALRSAFEQAVMSRRFRVG